MSCRMIAEISATSAVSFKTKHFAYSAFLEPLFFLTSELTLENGNYVAQRSLPSFGSMLIMHGSV